MNMNFMRRGLMGGRFMRILLFFDLPTETASDRRAYRQFRKLIIKEGFIMMQESVYSKLVINQQSANFMITKLKKKKPPGGLVQLLTVTEKQYASIIDLVGTVNHIEINSMDKVIVL